MGAVSNVRTFTISYNAPIGPPPTLVSPANGATVTLPFVLDWNDVPNPQSSGYVVEIATDSGFDNVEAPSTGLTNSQWDILGLSSGTKFWRVQHADGDSSPTTAAFSAPSAVRSFTVSERAPRWPRCSGCSRGADRVQRRPSSSAELTLTALAPAGGARSADQQQSGGAPGPGDGDRSGGPVAGSLRPPPLRAGDVPDAGDRHGDLRGVDGARRSRCSRRP